MCLLNFLWVTETLTAAIKEKVTRAKNILNNPGSCCISITRLTNIIIDTNTIIKFIRSLDPNKARGCDGISVCMSKCTASISKPLHILFNNGVINECFPIKSKKTNFIPVHKKGGKQIKNY